VPPPRGAPRPPGPPAGPPRAPWAGAPGPVTADCRGIIAGLGRGAPGTPPGRGAPDAPSGRSPRAAGRPWPGPVRRCMPWVEENGLLPGRGVPGLGAGRGVGAAADSAGASPSVGASGVAEAAGASAGRDGAASTEGADGRGAAGVSAGSNVSGAAGTSSVMAGPPDASTGVSVTTSAGASAAGAPLSAAAFLAGACLAAFFAAFSSAAFFQASPWSSSRRRATGASTVEEADLTNSPMSFSAARTSLLGTPNSLASSWTLALATILLLGWSRPEKGADRQLTDMLIGEFSSRCHELLLRFRWSVVVAPCGRRPWLCRCP
jgi:hypothetical protein